jgi:hypothetical protein
LLTAVGVSKQFGLPTYLSVQSFQRCLSAPCIAFLRCLFFTSCKVG